MTHDWKVPNCGDLPKVNPHFHFLEKSLFDYASEFLSSKRTALVELKMIFLLKCGFGRFWVLNSVQSMDFPSFLKYYYSKISRKF